MAFSILSEHGALPFSYCTESPSEDQAQLICRANQTNNGNFTVIFAKHDSDNEMKSSQNTFLSSLRLLVMSDDIKPVAEPKRPVSVGIQGDIIQL